MISRWTILNLRERPERKLLAACSARRAGVPDNIIHFHHGDVFQTPEELQEAGIKEDFQNIADTVTKLEKIKEKKKEYFSTQNQSYNILCYLRDRIERDTYEVFIHDDVYLYDATGYEYLCDICQKIGDFNILLLNQSYNWVQSLTEKEWTKDFFDKSPSSIEGIPNITKGLNSNCDFALVLSQEGAKMIYERLLTSVINIECIEHMVLRRQGEYGKWSPEGAYTVIKDIANRYCSYIVGSDVNHAEMFEGKYQQHVEE